MLLVTVSDRFIAYFNLNKTNIKFTHIKKFFYILTSPFGQAQSVPHVLPKNKINRIHKIIYFCQSYIRAVKSTGKAAGQKSAH